MRISIIGHLALIFWLACIPVSAIDQTVPSEAGDEIDAPQPVILEQIEPQLDVNKPTVNKVPAEPKGVKLTGGVQHSQTLPPVRRQLRAGKTFLESELPFIDSHDVWYRIPEWFAGIWEKRRETVTSIKPLSRAEKLLWAFAAMPRRYTFTAHTRIRNGHQRDAKRDLWSYLSYPYKTRVDGDETYTIQHIYLQEPVDLRKNRVSLKFVGTNYEVSRYNNKIASVKQVESITTYIPLKQGLIKAYVSMKVFNEKGKAKYLEKHEFFQYLIKPFSPQNLRNGKDLRSSFVHYLEANGLSDLIPQENP